MDDAVFDKGENAAKIGFSAVAILGILKGIIGVLYDSISLQAQAVDSLTDLVSLVAVYLALRLSRRPPNERFSYGYYRVETLVSLIVSVLILFTGGFMLIESSGRVFTPVYISKPEYVIGAAAVSIPILLWLAQYTKSVGGEIGSQALINQSEDYMSDFYSSIVVILGIFGSWIGYPSLEGLAGIIISLFIVKVGLELSWRSLLVLLDAVDDPDKLIEVKMLAERVPGVVEAKRVRLRRAGPFCIGEITLFVPEGLSVDKAHRLSRLVEDAVKSGVPKLESLVIQIQPIIRDDQRLALPVSDVSGLNSIVSEHFGTAPHFVFVDVNPDGVERWFVRENQAVDLEKKRGVTVTNMLLKEKTTALLSDELGEGPFHILRDSFVDVYVVEGGISVESAVKLFVNNDLSLRESAD